MRFTLAAPAAFVYLGIGLGITLPPAIERADFCHRPVATNGVLVAAAVWPMVLVAVLTTALVYGGRPLPADRECR